MGRSTDRTRRRTKRARSAGSDGGSRWFDHKLALLTPTPKDRMDWNRVRADVWQIWGTTAPENRPDGSKLAPIAALTLDWNGHYGPVFDSRGRRVPLTEEAIADYAALAGPGFEECRLKMLELI